MKGLTPEEHKALIVSVGTHRNERKLSPVEVARLMKCVVDSGTSRKELARSLQLGPTQVAVFLKLLDLDPSVQHLADWGVGASTIPFSSLGQLARLSAADQQKASQAILEHRLTWKEVVQLVQLADRTTDPIEECIQSVIALRPEIELRHVYIGAVHSFDLRRELVRLGQVERDRVFASAIGRVSGSEVELSGRLGVKQFTIVAAEDPVVALGHQTADELEASLNAAIGAEVDSV